MNPENGTNLLLIMNGSQLYQNLAFTIAMFTISTSKLLLIHNVLYFKPHGTIFLNLKKTVVNPKLSKN